MPSELGPVVKAMALERDTIGSLEVRRGKVGAAEVVATKTGIGTKRAKDATNRLLDAADLDHVLVVGIAGGMGATKVGDVIIPEVVVDKDSDAEYRPTPLGPVVPRGRLVTHDDFDMGEAEHQRLVAEGFVAVDMETAAIASVCAERGCNWSAVRAISDLVGVTPGDVINLANADGTPNVRASVRYLITKPWRIPKLVRLARESMQAANAAAQTAADTLRSL
jgi:adenosylhomocysteine nucleosidase